MLVPYTYVDTYVVSTHTLRMCTSVQFVLHLCVLNNIFNFISLQRKDILQLLIDASDSETKEGLEEGEIVADSVGFMLAGYETTSTTLTFATYLLAANPEAQERLANEIQDYFEECPVSYTDNGVLSCV